MKRLLRTLPSPIRTWCNRWNLKLHGWLKSVLPPIQHFPPLALEYANAENNLMEDSSVYEKASIDVFDLSILMAAPKSKVFNIILVCSFQIMVNLPRQISPSRKRQKHMRFFPDPVPWAKCDRCGEPKRPHRICSEHSDICGMRPDEYEAHKQKEKNSSTDNQSQYFERRNCRIFAFLNR